MKIISFIEDLVMTSDEIFIEIWLCAYVQMVYKSRIKKIVSMYQMDYVYEFDQIEIRNR